MLKSNIVIEVSEAFATWFSPSKFYFCPKTEIIMLAIQAPNRAAVKKGDKKKELLN